MTRDEVLAMKPGRELDALAARGWVDGMIGLVYEYRCREHGAKNPYVIFRNLRYLHLCPECNREMQKTYVSVRIFEDSLEHSSRWEESNHD